jgi:hypothetical protein
MPRRTFCPGGTTLGERPVKRLLHPPDANAADTAKPLRNERRLKDIMLLFGG